MTALSITLACILVACAVAALWSAHRYAKLDISFVSRAHRRTRFWLFCGVYVFLTLVFAYSYTKGAQTIPLQFIVMILSAVYAAIACSDYFFAHSREKLIDQLR